MNGYNTDDTDGSYSAKRSYTANTSAASSYGSSSSSSYGLEGKFATDMLPSPQYGVKSFTRGYDATPTQTPLFMKDRLRYRSTPDPSVYGKGGNAEWDPRGVPDFMEGSALAPKHVHLLR